MGTMTQNTACRYAIVRFMPFVETGEFANVGIVAVAPDVPYFGFKLLKRRYGRVTRFFEDFEGRVYRAVMSGLSNELDRVRALAEQKQGPQVSRLFEEVIRPRENMVRFSKPGVRLAANPEAAVEELYSHYVERSFHTKQHREKMLEQTVRTWLSQAHLGRRYRQEQVGDEIFRVRFPFVARSRQQVDRIIKPLHLGQEDASQILEQGGRWSFRVRELQKRRLLPRDVLFAVEGPSSNSARHEAYASAVEELSDTGIHVIPHQQRDAILDFARG